MLLLALLLLALAAMSRALRSPQRLRSLDRARIQQTTEIQSASAISTASTPKAFLLLSNLQSGANIGSICRNALAFNVSEVVVVGRKDVKMRQADRGARQRLRLTHFVTVAEAADYLQSAHNCTFIGIEICEQAVSLMTYEFSSQKNYCFLFGNEGGGLSPRQRALCDMFLYIPQYAPEGEHCFRVICGEYDPHVGMASINVACASAIVLQQFAHFAKYPETIRKGEKFL